MGRVLIVPYGIEMNKLIAKRDMVKVLIVPYGIEISCTEVNKPTVLSINCTLWN